MATARTMLRMRSRALARIAACCVMAWCATACIPKNYPTLVQPTRLVAPYPPSAHVTWVVAPFHNESGTSLVDELAVTDALVNQIREVDGLTALPTNRALAGLRALNIPAVRSPEEAIALAQITGADATVVGTITAWDPYDPPKLGITLSVYPRTAVMRGLASPAPQTDPAALRTATREEGLPTAAPSLEPSTSIADHADASNHAVLAEVEAYAYGRSDDRSALGWLLYVKSMERYTEFVCYRLMSRVLAHEATRFTPGTGHDNTR